MVITNKLMKLHLNVACKPHGNTVIQELETWPR